MLIYSRDSAFNIAAIDIRDNGTMNAYVGEAIDNKVPIDELEKEIKLAIKMHRKYDAQKGSSHLHSAVVLSMSRLLSLLQGFKG